MNEDAKTRLTEDRDTTSPVGDSTTPAPVVEVLPIGDLQPLGNNPRAHTTRGKIFLRDALKRTGPLRSGVIDETNTILAWNSFHEAAMAEGYREVVIVHGDGRPVFVKQPGLSTVQKAQAVVDDNRAGEYSGWNPHLHEYVAVDPTIRHHWTAPEWRQALGPDIRGGTTGNTDPDALPPEGGTRVAPGDVFRLGMHVVVCGDATDPAVVERLLAAFAPVVMITDPPWGVGYAPAWRAAVDGSANHRVGPVLNDDRVDWSPAYRLFCGPVAYVVYASRHEGEVAVSLRAAGLVPRTQIIWVKQHLVLGRGNYHQQHEPLWYCVRDGATSRWQGDRTQTTVWEIANLNPFGGDSSDENAHTPHATQKPVALYERPLLNHTEAGDAMYDPFAGSGTALIAAEKLGRRCLAIELSPEHVQVIIDRWEAFTGARAEKVGGR